jgi:hypothetical protein
MKAIALPNRHIHLYLSKLGYDVLALLSGDRYILSGENLASVYSTTRRRRDQNSTQVDNRQGRAGTLYVRLLHLSSMGNIHSAGGRAEWLGRGTPLIGWGDSAAWVAILLLSRPTYNILWRIV